MHPTAAAQMTQFETTLTDMRKETLSEIAHTSWSLKRQAVLAALGVVIGQVIAATYGSVSDGSALSEAIVRPYVLVGHVLSASMGLLLAVVLAGLVANVALRRREARAHEATLTQVRAELEAIYADVA